MKQKIISQKMLGYGTNEMGAYMVALNTWNDGSTNYGVTRINFNGRNDYQYVDVCPPISMTQEEVEKRLSS